MSIWHKHSSNRYPKAFSCGTRVQILWAHFSLIELHCIALCCTALHCVIELHCIELN